MALYQYVYRIVEGEAVDSRCKSTFFNRWILVVILISVIGAVIETEDSIYQAHAVAFDIFSKVIGLIFLVEYFIRLYASKANPKYAGKWGRIRYVFSFWAIVDLIAILPIFFTVLNSTPFIARLLRLVRIFRLLKIGRYSQAIDALSGAIHQRRYELAISSMVAIFLLFVSATGLYLAEAEHQPEKFGSIPRALWWSIATLTTVGYGDNTPITMLGKILAGITAMAGIGLIAMPTGILAAAFSDAFQKTKNTND